MKIAAGHAWDVWPDHGVTTPRRPAPEPETVAGLIERLRRLAAETHGEVCMSRVIAAVDLVEEALPAIRAEATAAALAPYVAALRPALAAWVMQSGWVKDSGHAQADADGFVLSLLAAPLSVREPDPGIRWCGDTELHKPHLMASVELRCPGDPWWAGSLLPTPVREAGLDVERLRNAAIALAGPPDANGIRCEETLQRAPTYAPCPRQAVNVTETNYGSQQMACNLHTTVTVRSGGKLVRPLTSADYEAAQEARRQEREDWWRDKADRLILAATPERPADERGGTE